MTIAGIIVSLFLSVGTPILALTLLFFVIYVIDHGTLVGSCGHFIKHLQAPHRHHMYLPLFTLMGFIFIHMVANEQRDTFKRDCKSVGGEIVTIEYAQQCLRVGAYDVIMMEKTKALKDSIILKKDD